MARQAGVFNATSLSTNPDQILAALADGYLDATEQDDHAAMDVAARLIAGRCRTLAEADYFPGTQTWQREAEEWTD